MRQLKLYLKRLKKPSVFLAICAQLSTFAHGFQGEGISILSFLPAFFTLLLSLFGIISDPDAEKKGFGDDFAYCKHCGIKTRYVSIAGKRYCRICGTIDENIEGSSTLIL